ncbi:hypothetical protein P5G50_06770 [Leifsonia sp. F6_8S_P_1B]|uniref:DUF2510 domain-containing protein n=1 Tax=Leifsonia williamsii TaxID=3035919 RepID=A0ABT8K9L6_9MICO|nr:hypothetical protein [Leifsonia williamsii]MDN4614153.1 hypothetical protein [Leifsonia williamsii]
MDEEPPREHGEHVPPTPDAAVRGYYAFPPPSKLWMYYNGETWVGEARELPWWRKPVDWAFARAPRGSFVIVGTVGAIGVVLHYLFLA